MRHRSSDGPRHRHQRPGQGGVIVAVVAAMMALGLFWGKEATAFLGPAVNGLPEQIMFTSGSSTIAASTRSASASSRTIKGARADTRATDVLWVFALFAGACSVRRMASRSASQHKHRSFTVACQAADVPMLFMPQPRKPVVEKLTPTPATMVTPPLVIQQGLSLDARTTTLQMMLESKPHHDCVVAPPSMAAQITKPRPTACRATMVGGARSTKPTARSSARHAKRHKAACRAASLRAAHRGVGSRLQAPLRKQERPTLSFDASRQRLKIQVGQRLAQRVHFRHMRAIRSLVDFTENSNGLFTTGSSMIEDFKYSTQPDMCYCEYSGKRLCYLAPTTYALLATP
mmetsp:Transcript_69955/g.135000  ORF Transcript_69955/g.135000 Transcript_69955/m.135000 type:complete len:345 (+) Transcript_69955:76-1110(+)